MLKVKCFESFHGKREEILSVDNVQMIAVCKGQICITYQKDDTEYSYYMLPMLSGDSIELMEV